ncbi:AraC family transcriptional regulator [Chroococcidiopsis sp. CCALA 051]|uniref:helix-turn-helix transcriptional regulator n=1 Tax=Chroococcidiopsis sp. CCALA 051 TaxID=869949 RepID=UPI000D0D8E7C|nr:AraC family transcriptional regulator [Chroococcidiopsis sp. CCALA 051]MBE9015319.1 helix-turn-helix transcriptional regulator [Chroococcidiopsidales cyanobacterium LEGE 13417]PSM46737.1 AraC family transcriptional regulator [Chroococcidiopsis sp. CCALA 051]
MTVTLTAQEEDDLWDEAAQHNPPQLDPDSGIEIHEMPQELGKGHNLFVELYPDCWLMIWNREYRETVQTKQPEWQHPLQFGVLLSGMVPDSQGGVLGNGCTMISGSGVQREISGVCFNTQSYLGINLEMSAEWLTTFFPDENGQLPAELSFLVKGNDWQTLIYPKTNPAIQGVAWQMIHCPYEGAAKRLYLQAKSLELMALQLAPIVADRGNPKPSPRMKPTTIARIYEARDILRRRLENPPSSLELATAVGLSDRTLQRGFQSLFGTTVVGYLAEQRLLQAEQLLRERSMTVTEVAHRFGYGHLGRFAAAFKRKFGITPSQCLLGKKVILGA